MSCRGIDFSGDGERDGERELAGVVRREEDKAGVGVDWLSSMVPKECLL